MCRFFAYSGRPVLLHDMLIAPEASLITQSSAARQAKTVVNGDGCGLGWYGAFERPGVFKDARPAWSDANFASLCEQIVSGQFMAHVRSATSGEVSRANSHPFCHGRHLFMHNGQIGGYSAIRRRIEALIDDRFYASRSGTSDSEAIFLIAMGQGLEEDPVAAVGRAIRLCLDVMRAEGVRLPLRFSAALCDGRTLHAFRWSSDRRPPSLFRLELEGGMAVSSEPFTLRSEPWIEIPSRSVLRATAGTFEVLPFDPEDRPS